MTRSKVDNVCDNSILRYNKFKNRYAPKKKVKFQKFREGLKKFSLSTSLHGFKYIGEKRTLPEKIFWIVVLICVFCLCACQTLALLRHWNEGKIIMTQENGKLKVWDIPFPALSICGENQLNVTQMKIAEQELNEEDLMDLKDYTDVLCYANYSANFTDNKLSEKVLQYAFKKMVLACNDTVISLVWINDYVNYPCQYFQPMLSTFGLCYSLNMIPHRQLFTSGFMNILSNYMTDNFFYDTEEEQPTWEYTSGFLDNNPFIPPWRVAGTGSYNSIKLVLNVHPEYFQNFCNLTGLGLTVVIHNPIDYPMHLSSYFIRPNTYNSVILTPKMVHVSDELQGWNPIDRGCYYQHEKVLMFFKIYSKYNCEVECKANLTLEMCGCLAFYHPSKK